MARNRQDAIGIRPGPDKRLGPIITVVGGCVDARGPFLVRPCEPLGPAWQMRQQFERRECMAHESVSDVTMGTETAVDRSADARPASKAPGRSPVPTLPTEWVGRSFLRTRARLDALLRAGFKALGGPGALLPSGEFVAIHDWKTTRTVPGTDYQIWNTSVVDAQ